MTLKEIERKYNNTLIISLEEIKYLIEQLEENEDITQEEKNKWNNIIIEDGYLLYYRSEYYINRFKSTNKKEDFDLFVYYSELSASKGYIKAYILLGDTYLNNEENENIKKFEDESKAFKYYKKAADKESAYAQNRLGLLYQKGIGVKQDYKKALEYYKKSADQDYVAALQSLGYMYANGLGVAQDYKKAFEYYKKASTQGNAAAQFYLGYMYYYGTGLIEDYNKAIKYLIESARNGDEDAKVCIMRYRYIEEEIVNYKELFSLEENRHAGDKYFEMIRDLINSGSKIISVESLTELISKHPLPEFKDKNKKMEYIINSIDQVLNQNSDDTIINIRQLKIIFTSVTQEFYKVSDIKKIIKVYKKILKDIDLNQSEEDIFMQIYIKLGMIISYDYSFLKDKKNEKSSISRNLMVLLNKKGVCQGYALVLKNILDIVGIESNYCYSVQHMYNQVKINGKWYYCDLTWDRDNMMLGFIINCLKSRKKFSKSIYHQTRNTEYEREHESNEDYHNVYQLFIKNSLKLFYKKLNTPIGQSIEPAGIIEEEGKTK